MTTSVIGGGDDSWGDMSGLAVMTSRIVKVVWDASSSILKPAFALPSSSAAAARIGERDSGEENARSDQVAA